MVLFLPLTTFWATFCSGDILCGGGGRQQVFVFFFLFWLLVIESEGVVLQYGKQRERERAVRGDSSFFFRVLEGGRRDGWSLKKIEKEAIFTLEEDYSGKFTIDS